MQALLASRPNACGSEQLSARSCYGESSMVPRLLLPQESGVSRTLDYATRALPAMLLPR
jgi:hypothetical protein